MRGVALKMVQGDGHAKKNSHPPFILTKRHLWRRDEKFSLLPWRLHAVFFHCQVESCSSAFKALSVYSRERTWLFYYSTTIIILLLHFSFFAQYLSPLCCNCGMLLREGGLYEFFKTPRESRGCHFALHVGLFSYWTILRQSSPSLLFIVYL